MRGFLGSPCSSNCFTDPTPTHGDNTAVIVQIRKNRLTPQIKHLDLKIIWFHQYFIQGTFEPLYIDTKINCVDANSKPTSGDIVQSKTLQVIGFIHYPPKDSVHYTLLQLYEYDIGVHRGNFIFKHSYTKDEK